MIDIALEIEQKQVYLALVYKGQVSLFFCRSPPVDSILIWVDGRFFMKKIKVDGYEIIVENGKFTKATFTDTDGNEVTINLGEDLRLEFVKRRREEFKEQYEKRKHIDRFIKDDYMFEVKSSNNSYSIEDEFIEEDEKNRIIKEIWNLPTPQNKRVFMNLINKYSLSKIAEIEGVSVNAIKLSVSIGIKNLKRNLQNLKKF